MTPSDPTIKHADPPPSGNFHVSRQFILRLVAVLVVIVSLFVATNKIPTKREKQPIATQVGLPTSRSLRAEKADAEQAPEEAARMRADRAERDANEALAKLQGRHGGLTEEREYSNRYQQEPQQDPVAADREKHLWTSLFASPVARSYRAKEAPVVSSSIAPADPHKDYSEPISAGQTPSPGQAETLSAPGKLTLYAGTVIEGALKNGLQGEFAGPVVCMISTNVYAGYPYPVVVIPAGSTIIGKADKVQEQDQQALSISFTDITMPNGTTLHLNELALDQGGETAVRDKVNHHYMSTFATSVALGLLGGLSLAGTQGGYTQDGADAYRQGVSRQLGSDARQILGHQLNRLPTVSIRPGHRVSIILTKQMRVSPYALP